MEHYLNTTDDKEEYQKKLKQYYGIIAKRNKKNISIKPKPFISDHLLKELVFSILERHGLYMTASEIVDDLPPEARKYVDAISLANKMRHWDIHREMINGSYWHYGLKQPEEEVKEKEEFAKALTEYSQKNYIYIGKNAELNSDGDEALLKKYKLA